jgi:hypothetical protein
MVTAHSRDGALRNAMLRRTYPTSKPEKNTGKWRTTMKKILLVSASLAALIATPALAQNYQYDQSRNTAWYGRNAPAAEFTPRGAFARDYQGSFGGFSNQVVEGGKVLGADPDPNVRLELRRDYESSNF